jgi:hypothetical protein
MSTRLELVGQERVLDGADLARLDRWADRRGVGPWWRRLTFGLGPGATVGQLLEQADERRQGPAARAFLLGHGVLRTRGEGDDQAGGQ